MRPAGHKRAVSTRAVSATMPGTLPVGRTILSVVRPWGRHSCLPVTSYGRQECLPHIRRPGMSVLRPRNRFASELIALYYGRPKQLYRRLRVRVTSPVIQRAGGAARHSFFWCGAARSRFRRLICANWPELPISRCREPSGTFLACS